MIDAGHKVDGIRPTLVTTGSMRLDVDRRHENHPLFEFIGTVDRTDHRESGTTTQATPLGSVVWTQVRNRPGDRPDERRHGGHRGTGH